MRAAARLVTAFPVLLVALLASCGGASGDSGFGSGAGPGSGAPATSSGGGASGSGSFGSGGSGASQPCSTVGSTRSCCATGTQTCTGGSEFPVWSPCVDASGATLTCNVTGGGGTEDGGGPGHGGGGGEDGGTGGGGGGGEDASLPIPALCNDQNVNTEPEILVGYSPATGQTVGATGQIRVWVNDENPPIIAPGEQVDPATGKITLAGDRTAKAPDGYLWEPALYIAPQTAENGGTPHFPQWIKGSYQTDPNGNGNSLSGGMDPVPAGATLAEQYTGEDVWDVSALGLGPGTYMAEFVIHDGDDDRAVGCVTIVVTP